MSLINPVRTVEKFVFTNFSKIGALVTTWYTVLQIDNSELFGVYFSQDNTDGAAKSMSVRLTVDGEIFPLLTLGALADEELTQLALEGFGGAIPAQGDLPELQGTTNRRVLTWCHQDHAAGFTIGSGIPIKGKDIKIEFYMNTVGANQNIYCDSYSYHKEAA